MSEAGPSSRGTQQIYYVIFYWTSTFLKIQKLGVSSRGTTMSFSSSDVFSRCLCCGVLSKLFQMNIDGDSRLKDREM